MVEQAVEIIVDALGRKLIVREVGILQQTRLLRAIGPGQALNQPYVNTVITAAMVTQIDEVPTRPITTERDIDGAIERLGDEGMVAVALYRERQIDETMKALQAASDSAYDQGKANPGPLERPNSSPVTPPSESASTSSPPE